jgi:SWI/SNF-related matrix-associated actin-dependent regulator 1 of chromatin subfamily A
MEGSDGVKTEQYDDGFGPRIALHYPYDPDTNSLLKDVLGFPAFKWDKDKKVWSIQSEPKVIREAVELLGTRNYDFTALLTDVKKSPGSYNPCVVTLKGARLILRWPFIKDEAHRSNVLSAVKSIPGRKWHAEQKHWSIPLAHGHNLYGLLETLYKPLADALKAEPAIATYLEESIARVEISQAAELTGDKVAELKTRLDKVLAPDVELYPFQYVGVAFAEMAHGRCLIGDDMGIGKTMQALAYAALNTERFPCVVVCPANVKYNWRNELTRWLPQHSVHVVDTGKEEIPSTDFIIINFDLMTKQKDRLLALAPDIIIVDESHLLANSKAQRTKSTLALCRAAKSVLCLSGTAISSRPKEFYNTLNLLKPDQFPSFYQYAQRYCDPWHNGYGWDFKGASNTEELNGRIRDFTIRRLKDEVLAELPPKTRTFLPVELTKAQRTEYDQSADDWGYQYDNYMNFGGMPPGFVLNMLTDLRHACGRMKANYAIEWVQDYHSATGKPLVVFCHHRDVLDVIYDTLDANGPHAATISGSTSSKERDRIITAFQAGKIPVLICNTIAAKEGITLTAADTVLFIEREWVPSWEEQAEDRIHRIGQESNVHAVYLSCMGTVDEHFDRVVESKRRVVKAVLDGAETEEGRATLVTELLSRLKNEGGWKTTEVNV